MAPGLLQSAGMRRYVRELRNGCRSRVHSSAVYTPGSLLRRPASSVLWNPYLQLPAHEHLHPKRGIRRLSVRLQHRGNVRVSLNERCPIDALRSAAERESMGSNR
jgi:hypothetical protein